MAKSLFRALVALSFLAPLWLNAAPRVITLSPANTELAFAAGITPVGVSSYSEYPPQAQKIEQVSTWQGMNLERIVALKPDLVIAPWLHNLDQHLKHWVWLILVVVLVVGVRWWLKRRGKKKPDNQA